jgi:serine/threonine-protein kinase
MRFELLTELGRGGTGVVFKARDRESGAVVALKRLNPDVKFAEREVLLARTVTHANVCKVYDLFREDGHACISMELIDGETLQDFLKRSDPPSIDQTLGIARQIMDGLEAAHRAGIVHRDLNPQNILIARDGTVKITDFGVARVAGPRGLQPTRTDISGTPGYMAPEQIIGLYADARTDLYALGFILYQMVYRVRRVPAWLEAAITCCTQRDPEQRY